MKKLIIFILSVLCLTINQETYGARAGKRIQEQRARRAARKEAAKALREAEATKPKLPLPRSQQPSIVEQLAQRFPDRVIAQPTIEPRMHIGIIPHDLWRQLSNLGHQIEKIPPIAAYKAVRDENGNNILHLLIGLAHVTKDLRIQQRIIDYLCLQISSCTEHEKNLLTSENNDGHDFIAAAVYRCMHEVASQGLMYLEKIMELDEFVAYLQQVLATPIGTGNLLWYAVHPPIIDGVRPT